MVLQGLVRQRWQGLLYFTAHKMCSVTKGRHLVSCKFLLSCLGLLSSHAVRRGHHICPWQVYVLIQVLHEREHFCSVAPCTNEILMPHGNHTRACTRVMEHLFSNRRADLIQGRSESERCVEVSRALRSSALYCVHDQVPHLRGLAKDAPVSKGQTDLLYILHAILSLEMQFFMARPRRSFS